MCHIRSASAASEAVILHVLFGVSKNNKAIFEVEIVLESCSATERPQLRPPRTFEAKNKKKMKKVARFLIGSLRPLR